MTIVTKNVSHFILLAFAIRSAIVFTTIAFPMLFELLAHHTATPETTASGHNPPIAPENRSTDLTFMLP